MSFLLDPRRFAWRLHARTAPGEIRRTERVLASARVFLSITFLAALYVVPTEPGSRPPLVQFLLLAYVVHSILVMFLVRKRMRSTGGFRLLVHGADIVWPAAISLFTGGLLSPFFLFFLFVLLASAYRWGFWETLATSAASIVLLVAENAMGKHSVIASSEVQSFMGMNRLLLDSAYLLSMGLLIGYLAENEKQLRAEKAVLTRSLAKLRVENGLSGNLQPILEELLLLFGGSEALVAIEEARTGRLFAWQVAASGAEGAGIRYFAPGELDGKAYLFPTSAHSWYAARKNAAVHVVALDADGTRLRRHPPDFLGLLAAARAFRSLLSVSLAATDQEWWGRLYLFNPKLPKDREEATRVLQDLVRQLSPAVSNVYLLRRLRQRAGAIERARLARDLHDGVIQSLIGIEMQVDVLRRRLPERRGEITNELSRIQGLLSEEVLKVRELMQQMKSLAVDSSTLIGFLNDLVAKFQRETGISARFASDANVDLAPRPCRELACIVQEALINVRKHSRARRVEVELRSGRGGYHLSVQDNGIGFDFSGQLSFEELERRHQGPAVIMDRVRSMGGDLTLHSQPGRSSRLEITIQKE
jgi:signal transduction histidine kinase